MEKFALMPARKKYVMPFQVRTAGGKLIGHFGNVESAEGAWNDGRSRTIWKWDNMRGEYFSYR
jgi:hypothetical protein